VIDVLIPVLARPQNAEPLIVSLMQSSSVSCRTLFLCSEGDEAQIEACLATGEDVLVADFGEQHQYPKKMNKGFERTEQPFLLLASDDLDFKQGWDELTLQMAEATGAGVIGTNDKANRLVVKGQFSTHPLVRRSYVEEQGGSLDGPGILVSESYDHNFVDRELCHLAQARKQWAFAQNAEIVHRHPAWGTAPQDATYEKGRLNFGVDQELFWDRAEQWGYVGLLPQELSIIRRRRRRYTHPRR